MRNKLLAGLAAAFLVTLPAAPATLHRTQDAMPEAKRQQSSGAGDSGIETGLQVGGSILQMILLNTGTTPGAAPVLPGGSDLGTVVLEDDSANDQDARNPPAATGLMRGLVPEPGIADELDCAGLNALPTGSGHYWNAQAPSQTADTQFSMGIAGMIETASGGANQVTAAGSVGAWCRPATQPFADSSPLASRSMWTPVFVLAFGVGVFLVTRGWRLPS